MNWLKFVFLAGTFITSYGLTNNFKPTGNHVNSPWTTSYQIRNKRSVEILNTGQNRWEARVKLPPFVTDWMSKPPNANYVREITQRLQNGIKVGRNEITGSGNGDDWILESRPLGTPPRQVPIVEQRKPNVQPTNFYDWSSEETDPDNEISPNDDFMPCKYGTSENPFPVPNIIKTGRRVSDIKCEEHMWHLKYRIIDAKENKKQCMIHKSITQVVGGDNSIQGQYPHMGAVGWLAINNKKVFLCGTTLISSRFSLTAGHCRRLVSYSLTSHRDGILDSSPKIVRFGAVDINNENDGELIDMRIDTIITPPEYLAHPHYKYNDLGLIRFTEEVQFSEYVRPACIWSGSLDGLSTGVITGWGETKDGERSLSSRLQYANVDFFDNDVCRDTMNPRRNRLWRNGIVDHQFCAGKMSGGVDTCGGDSGGPIQIRQPLPMDRSASMHYVVGITNFGIRCAEPNLPGVYTNVSHFLCWIEKTVWDKEVNSRCI